MSDSADKELRCELLFRALEAVDDPETALALAGKMESFVVHGTEASEDVKDLVGSAWDRGPELLSEPEDTAGDKAEVGGPGKKPRWSEGDTRALSEMWENGVPSDAIAEKLGRSQISVRAHARRLGLAPRRAGKGPERVKGLRSNGGVDQSQPAL